MNRWVALLAAICAVSAAGQNKPRARGLGVPFEGVAGPLNAIVDVAGVEVGHKTLISGDGKLQVGAGPVRTGVTAIWPRGKRSSDPVFAGWFSQNGNGEMTGTPWLEESGFADGPILITCTFVKTTLVTMRERSGLNSWVLSVAMISM